MKLSVCIDALFPHLPPSQAVSALGGLGIPAFEFWSWWDKDLSAIQKASEESGIQIAAFCTRHISLTDPNCRNAYYQGLKDSISVAKQLSCNLLISQVGDDTGAEREAQLESIISGLRLCAPLLEDTGITLVIEPLNTKVDHKGYFLSRSQEGFSILQQVDSPAVKLLFDIYHQQITEGDLLSSMLPHLPQIGHLHAAGVPSRHELDQGEIHYPYLLAALQRAGYTGYLGLEYSPQFTLEQPLSGVRACLEMLQKL